MLVLASQSARRREILLAAGIPFIVRASSTPELLQAHESADEYVSRLARAKSEAVACNPGEVILGADTVVVLDEQILEKPDGPKDAARMLRSLSGREHTVVTGICLRDLRRSVCDFEKTRVFFNDLNEEEIQNYVASGEPDDKAGAYAIQGLASKFVKRIEGCYFNVVGLPVARLYGHLKAWPLEGKT